MAAVLICCSALTVFACHHGAGKTEVRQTPKPNADSLIVSVEEVRQIAGLPNLKPDPHGDERQPYHASPGAPGPCQPVSDEQAAFGDAWTQFRGVGYSVLASPTPGGAKKLSTVNQAVSIYPNTEAARNAFDKLVPQLDACSALHAKYYDFTLTRPDASTVTLTYAGHFEAASIYKVQSEHLLLVSALAVPHPGQTARDVLEKITARIN